MKEYKDKIGDIINEGMFLQHETGIVEKILAGTDQYGNATLGIRASDDEIYPLNMFSMNEWKIFDGIITTHAGLKNH